MGHSLFSVDRIENLKRAKTLSDLAVLLGYRPKAFSYILYKIPECDRYHQFTIPKKFGGERLISAPTEELKLLQQRLAELLSFIFETNQENRKPLSYAFRPNLSIVSNARRHKNKRYVFNIDLKDFFPSINFGRVRGYFIKDKGFNLNAGIATLIAQISCFNNELPQGAPTSPIISNLIASILDIRLARLAKKGKCNYSRYADDITFSTNQKIFPELIAKEASDCIFEPSQILIAEIRRAGFSINESKTSMQFKTSRQVVTGLLVNKKINIKKEYYRQVRSMCNSLFTTNHYNIKKPPCDGSGYVEGTINQLEGRLNFIYTIKPHYVKSADQASDEPTAITVLYRRFLSYKYFHATEKPLIVCEGITDSIYLKCALNKLSDKYPELINKAGAETVYGIHFLNKRSQTFREVMRMAEGSSGLLFLLNNYHKYVRSFRSGGMRNPVIILVDNDDGAKGIKSRLQINNNSKPTATPISPFYFFESNLYILFVPVPGPGAIEDLFPADILESEFAGKKFNRSNSINREHEFGKIVFAENIVKPKQAEIDFTRFCYVFDEIRNIIDDYSKRKKENATAHNDD